MKPGTIVAVRPFTPVDDAIPLIKWLPIRDGKTEYIIRGLREDTNSHRTIYYLEEGVVGHNHRGVEIGFSIHVLIELLPPATTEEIMEAINSEELVA